LILYLIEADALIRIRLFTILRKGNFDMLFLIIGALIAILVIWVITVQRKLVVMDENINNAMSQIGVQLSSRFDALTALLDLMKGYAAHESQTLIDTIKFHRRVLTAKSTPDDVRKQEGVIAETLGRISMVTEQYPELKANKDYIKNGVAEICAKYPLY
jgi:LemA protein